MAAIEANQSLITPCLAPAESNRVFPVSPLKNGPLDGIEFLQTAPILRIFDYQKALDFYVGFLGFTKDWEHRFDEKAPVFMQLTRAGCVLHLSEHHGDCCPGSTLYVRMRGIEEFHREISATGDGFMRPGIKKTFYHSKCMEVIDPFGNRIRFDESLPRDP